MHRMTVPIPRVLLLPILACLLALSALDAAAENAPPEITTDSTAYCLQLHERVENLLLAATVAPRREVADLSAEGMRMCDNGLAKGGVMRLRRALTIMTHPDEGH